MKFRFGRKVAVVDFGPLKLLQFLASFCQNIFGYYYLR
jgi:hypothetical protein